MWLGLHDAFTVLEGGGAVGVLAWAKLTFRLFVVVTDC